MAEIFMTPEEETLITELKAFFYYPSAENQNLVKSVNKRIEAIDKPRRASVTSALLVEISYEQAERRRYIIEVLGIGRLEKDEQEIFIRRLNENPTDVINVLRKTNPQATITNTSPDAAVLEQAKIFDTVAKQLEQYFSVLIADERIKTIFGLIKGLGAERRQQLSQDLSAFLAELERMFGAGALGNAQISTGVIRQLEAIGLSDALKKYETFGERVNFINRVRTVVDALIANQNLPNPLSDEELIQKIAVWSYYQDPPPLLAEEDLS